MSDIGVACWIGVVVGILIVWLATIEIRLLYRRKPKKCRGCGRTELFGLDM
jgi:hypothetical protein